MGKKSSGPYHFTQHARYKMQQYGLSEQRIRSVIRNPKRKEEGIVPRTAAMMQPVSLKRVDGKLTWKQEIWVMIIKNSAPRKKPSSTEKLQSVTHTLRGSVPSIRIISAWRYPGISPERNPIPEDILRELADGSILEPDNF